MEQPSFGSDNMIKNENNFDILFECMPQPLILTDFDSENIINVNKLFCSNFGFVAHEIIGKSLSNIGFWRDSEPNVAISELKKKTTLSSIEIVVFDSLGKPLNVLLSANLLNFNGCKTLLITIVDISDRKKSEKALQDSEKKYKAVFDNNTASLAFVNPDTTIAEVNDAYCESSGYSREAVIGLSWTKQITEDELERIKEYNQKRLLNPSEVPKQYETSYYTPQGKRHYMHMSVHLMPETNVRLISFVDTTQRKLDELLMIKQAEEIALINQQLQEYNKIRDKIYSIIAHDLRSPLSAIISFSHLLDNEFDNQEMEVNKKQIKMINQTSLKMNSLITNLLYWVNNQIDKVTLNPVNVNIELLFQEIKEITDANALQKNITIKFDHNQLKVFCDYEILVIILRNLVSNSIKFTHKNGQIYIDATINNGLTTISVTDNGVGISAEQLKSLERKDMLLSTQGTDKESGTGLGLFLCKELTEKNGGKFIIESEVGKGTRVHIILPSKVKMN